MIREEILKAIERAKADGQHEVQIDNPTNAEVTEIKRVLGYNIIAQKTWSNNSGMGYEHILISLKA